MRSDLERLVNRMMYPRAIKGCCLWIHSEYVAGEVSSAASGCRNVRSLRELKPELLGQQDERIARKDVPPLEGLTFFVARILVFNLMCSEMGNASRKSETYIVFSVRPNFPDLCQDPGDALLAHNASSNVVPSLNILL